jgi:2,3-bisphosphoglycerate-independent phosphoglycerate mutase
VISAVDLIQEIVAVRMKVVKVEGATGTFETNFTGKAAAAIDVLSRGADFVYVHIELRTSAVITDSSKKRFTPSSRSIAR